MRLLPAHEVYVAHRPLGMAGQRRRPDQAGGAVAQQIHDLDRRDVVERRKRRQALAGGPAVARLVEVEVHAVCGEIHDIGHAGAVDIGEADAALVELVRDGRTRARCPC